VLDGCEYHMTQTEEFTGNAICDFELSSHKYAWLNEATQHMTADSPDAD